VDTGVFSYASHAAYIAVDAQTGLVEILDYAICEDCGTMVNPMIVDGQTIGGRRKASERLSLRGKPLRRQRTAPGVDVD